jgi:hypothetical protein
MIGRKPQNSMHDHFEHSGSTNVNGEFVDIDRLAHHELDDDLFRIRFDRSLGRLVSSHD